MAEGACFENTDAAYSVADIEPPARRALPARAKAASAAARVAARAEASFI